MSLPNKNYFFDRAAVINMMDRKERGALSKAGGTVRLIARRSIRRVGNFNKYSQPGQPPFTHSGFLRNDILYAYDPTTRSVVIGPSQQPWLNHLHEFGGVSALKEFRNVEHGMLRYWRKGPQSRRRWKATGRIVKKRYPARPFMAPALEKASPSLPAHWSAQLAA